MSQRPRLQLIAPVQIRLTKPLEYNLEQFKKGDVITVEEFQADALVNEQKHAEFVKASEKLESINRFSTVEKKATKAEVEEDAKAASPAPVVKDQSGANATPANAQTK